MTKCLKDRGPTPAAAGVGPLSAEISTTPFRGVGHLKHFQFSVLIFSF